MALHTRLSHLAIYLLGATATAAHVLLPFSHGEHSKLSARASSEQVSLKSAEYPYIVDVTVGTPPQKLSLVVSPTTGDTWVPDANTLECSPDWYYRSSYRYNYDDDDDNAIPKSVCDWGSFNKSKSETYLPANSLYADFGDNYADNSYVSGTNMTDKLVVGNIELDDFPMGLVTSSGSRWLGVLGLGFNRSSSSSSYSYSSYSRGSYANFMDRVVSSGKAATLAYSIWLDNAEGKSGGLLFGAIDQSRYTGNLLRIRADGEYTSPTSSSSYSYVDVFATAITSMNGTTESGSMPPIRTNQYPLPVTIGPADVFSFLHSDLADKMASLAGATYNTTLSYFTIPCDAGKTNSAKFVLELGGKGGPKLNVETADLVVPISALSTRNSRVLLLNGTNTCFFGVQKRYSSSSSSESSSSSYNIGSSLLRRSYMVFDVANQEIALAPAKFVSGSDAPSPTIVAFASYGAKAPSATLVCTGGWCPYECGTTDCISPTSTSSSGSRSGSSSFASSQRDHWRTVAIALGVTFGVLGLIGIITAVIICTRLRREKKAAKEVEEGSEDGVSEPTAAQNGTGMRAAPPTLPVIQENQEPAAADTHQAAPQLPALGTQVDRPITPPQPAATSNRDSVAVSALSEEPAASGQDAAAAPGSPKGKGKAVDS